MATTLTSIPIQTVNVFDDRVDFQGNEGNALKYAIPRSGSNPTWMTFNANNPSATNAIWNITPPSERVLVDRKMWLKMTFTLTVTASVPNANNLFDASNNAAAIRSFPISQFITSATLTLNNHDMASGSMKDYIPLLQWFIQKDEFKLDYTSFPAMPDQSQNYSDLFTAGAASFRSPLSSFANSVANENYPPRGAYPFTVTNNTTGSYNVTFTVCEPLMMSPAIWGQEQLAFTRLKTMSLNLNFGNAAKLWSVNQNYATAGGPITSITAAVNSAQWMIGFISPEVNVPIPNEITYEYNQINVQTQSTVGPASTPSGSSFTITGGAVQLNQVPKLVYLAVRQADTNASFLPTSSNSFAGITNVNITFDNQNGFVAGASQEQLWQMARSNGSEQSWLDFSKYAGSIVCLEFGKDIGLGAAGDNFPGVLKNLQFQVTLQCSNINTTTAFVNPELVMIFINPGVIQITPNDILPFSGVITPQVALSTTVREGSRQKIRSIYGGDFLSSLKSILNKGANIVKSIAPAVSMIPGVGEFAAPVAMGADLLAKLTGGQRRALKGRIKASQM